MDNTSTNLPDKSFITRLVNAMTRDLGQQELENLIRMQDVAIEAEMAEEVVLMELVVEQRATTGVSNDTLSKLASVGDEINYRMMIFDAIMIRYKKCVHDLNQMSQSMRQAEEIVMMA